MIRGSLYADSDSLRGLDVRMTSAYLGQGGKPQPYLNLDLGRANLILYIAPEDLTRLAGMLRLTAENIEAIIGAPSEKATESISHRIPSPVASAA